MVLARACSQLSSIRSSIAPNQEALLQNRRQSREIGRLLASVQCDLFNLRLEARRRRGEITREEELGRSRKPQDFMSAAVSALLEDPLLDAPSRPPVGEPPPRDLGAAQAAMEEESKRLVALQEAVTEAQRQLAGLISELGRARAEYDAFVRAQAPPKP